MFQERHALETPEHVSVEFEVAGPMSRYAAALFDLLVISIGLAAVLLVLLVVALATGGGARAFGDLMLAGGMIFYGAALLLYFPLFEAFWRGQTPGKRALGIRVMRRDMAPFGFGAAFLRHALRFVDSLPGLPFPLLGLVVMTISERSLRLGDLAAGTWVVRDADAAPLLDKRAKAAVVGPATARRREAQAAASSAGAASSEGRLTEDEYRIAREFVARRAQLDPETRRATALRIASPMIKRLGIQALDADRFLEEEVARGPAGRRLI